MNYTIKFSKSGQIIKEVNTNVIPVTDVGQSRVSDILPFLKLIALDFNLDISTKRGYDIALKILKNSVKNN